MNEFEFEKVFFQVATPSTLASLVRDASGGTPAQQRVAIDAFKALEAIVGYEEAKKMVGMA